MLLSDALKKPRKKASKQTSAPTPPPVAPPPAPPPPASAPTPPVIGAAERARVATDVVRALNDAIRNMDAWSAHAAKLDGNVVVGGYRSHLPKEGSYEVGYSRYREMVSDEIARWLQVLNPHLAPYKSSIKRMSVQDEEKSWIYTEIELK